MLMLQTVGRAKVLTIGL